MRKLSSLTKYTIIVAVIIILLIFFHYLKILSPFENLVVRIISPVQVTFYSVSSSMNNFISRFTYDKDLYQENIELKNEITEIKLENSELKIYKKETENLNEQFDFLNEKFPDQKYVFSRVIGKSQQNPGLIFINRGKKDNIQSGLPVLIDRGIMIGKVMEVYNDYSSLLLVTDNKSSVAGLILNKDETSKLISGEHGLSMKMELIPQYEEVVKGDIIVTSGLESYIPKGLVIGEVEEVIYNPNELFKSARVKPITALENINLVTLLIP